MIGFSQQTNRNGSDIGREEKMSKVGGNSNVTRTPVQQPPAPATPAQTPQPRSSTGHSSQNTFETPTAGQLAGGATVSGAPLAAATNIADDAAKVTRSFANAAHGNVARVFTEGGEAALNSTQAHRIAANLETNALRTANTAGRLNTAGNVLGIAGGALTAVDQGLNSSAQSNEARVVSGTLAGTASYALGATNPYLAAGDALAGLAGAPDTPGNVLNKSIDSIVTVGEAAVTQDISGLENLNERNLRGDNGPVFQAAAEAGEYWAEHGVVGGLKNAWDALF